MSSGTAALLHGHYRDSKWVLWDTAKEARAVFADLVCIHKGQNLPIYTMQATNLASMCRCQHRLSELGFPVLPVCQLHWSAFAQEEEEDDEQEGSSEQEDNLDNPEQEGPSEQEGASEQQGFFEQQDVSEQEGASDQEGVSGEEGVFEQEGASGQEGVSDEEGASEQQDNWRTILEDWMAGNDLTMDSDCFVIKPADESQGRGVLLVNDFESLEMHALRIFQQVSSLCRSK